jgi:glycosyltransferase involved in cell wall biosynthesis
VIEGVTVHRLPGEHVQGRGLLGYAREYLAFAWRAAFAAARLHRARRYHVAQAHTLPDFLIFSLLPLRLVGVPLILDLHEAMPAFFGSRFPEARRFGAVTVLKVVEAASIAVSAAAITVNDTLRDRLVDLDIPRHKVSVVVNSPAVALFDRTRQHERAFMEDGVLRLVYAGSLTPLYEVDVVIDAVAALHATGELPIHFDIYGRGDTEEQLQRQAGRLGLGAQVRFLGRVPVEEVAVAIAGSDIGLAPTRLDAYTAMSMSTKVLESVVLGRLVVASRLPTVEHYFGPEGLAYYEPGDASSLAATLQRLVADPALRDRLLEEGAARLRAISWESQAAGYVRLVRSLADGASVGVPGPVA